MWQNLHSRLTLRVFCDAAQTSFWSKQRETNSRPARRKESQEALAANKDRGPLLRSLNSVQGLYSDFVQLKSGADMQQHSGKIDTPIANQRTTLPSNLSKESLMRLRNNTGKKKLHMP